MAVPKKRRSRTRKRMRRSHQALEKGTFAVCSETKEPCLPHRIGPSGFYGGVLIDSRAAREEYQAE